METHQQPRAYGRMDKRNSTTIMLLVMILNNVFPGTIMKQKVLCMSRNYKIIFHIIVSACHVGPSSKHVINWSFFSVQVEMLLLSDVSLAIQKKKYYFWFRWRDKVALEKNYMNFQGIFFNLKNMTTNDKWLKYDVDLLAMGKLCKAIIC